jgi:hypothetical protein
VVGGWVFEKRGTDESAGARNANEHRLSACATAAAALYAGERCWGQAMLLLYMAELGGEREREISLAGPPTPAAQQRSCKPTQPEKEGRWEGRRSNKAGFASGKPTPHTHTHSQSVRLFFLYIYPPPPAATTTTHRNGTCGVGRQGSRPEQNPCTTSSSFAGCSFSFPAASMADVSLPHPILLSSHPSIQPP